MTRRLKKRKLPFFIIIIFILLYFVFVHMGIFPASDIVLGGNLRAAPNEYIPPEVDLIDAENISARFFRPSDKAPFINKYSFQDFENKPIPAFSSPEDVICAYFGILENASNMLGYNVGCGTIGMADLPYPYAYELLSSEAQKKMSLKKFEDSFAGIGHIALLKIYPAYIPPNTPKNISYYMIELEIITGPKDGTYNTDAQMGLFGYLYGIISVYDTGPDGYKIDSLDYFPENYLCAPWHHWFYLSEGAVQIVYGDNLNLIDKIDLSEKDGDYIKIFASKGESRYRFDFVRLTNGYDILLHEYTFKDGSWNETNLLTSKWEHMKFSALSFSRP